MAGRTRQQAIERAAKGGEIMLKKLGALLFFLIVIVAAIGLANFLSITFYEKPLLAVIKDLVFIFTRK